MRPVSSSIEYSRIIDSGEAYCFIQVILSLAALHEALDEDVKNALRVCSRR